MRFLRILGMLLCILAVHEFGHYGAMRAAGVRVEEVSIGVGPLVRSWPLGDGTSVTLRLLPLGGYTAPVLDGPHGMLAQPLPAVIATYLAGMFMNAMLAFLLFLAATSIWSGAARGLGIGPPFRWSVSAAFVGWLRFPVVFVVAMFRDPRRFFGSVFGPIGLLSGVGPETDEKEDADGKEDAPERPPLPRGFALLMMFGHLSAIIAGANLLPFAPLDGGMVVASVLEHVAGAPLATAYVALSMSMLAVLFVVIFTLDLLRVLRRVFRPRDR